MSAADLNAAVLRAGMRDLYAATTDRTIFAVAVYEHAVADMRLAGLEAELAQIEQRRAAA